MMSRFVHDVRQPVTIFGVYYSIHATQETIAEKTKAFEGVAAAFKEALPEARKALEGEFRAILGVTATVEA